MKTENNEIRKPSLKDALLADIFEAKNDIDIAWQSFNMVYKPEEVDVYVYRLRAAEAKYDSLLKKLKEL